MQIYLVGGAVRDQLLHLPVKEKDWVVVGSTEAEMLAQGFVKVGKDFPVFLHPETHEEYALARTERKTGKGYYGFSCYAAADVTLEQDLLRRDLTINAIAQDPAGNIIDPYHGQNDINQKLLRHVSPAFNEDPVRILRVARFAARFAALGFHVAEETNRLMRHMVGQGKVNELVAERVWQEWQRALSEEDPQVFFKVLDDCTALDKLFPEIKQNYSLVLQSLTETSRYSIDPLIRFIAIALCIPGESLNTLCARYRLPSEYRELAALMQSAYHSILKIETTKAEELLQLLVTLDAWRRSARFEFILNACTVINSQSLKAVQQLKEAYVVTNTINPAEFVAQGLQGPAIHAALQEKRLQALKCHSR